MSVKIGCKADNSYSCEQAILFEDLVSKSETKQRNASIDNAKGILILMVVAGHVYVKGASAVPADLIYLIHMPLFFVYGCYFGKPLSIALVKDRAARLLIPYFCLYFLTPQLTNSLVKLAKFISNQPIEFTWFDFVKCGLLSLTAAIGLFMWLLKPTHDLKNHLSTAILTIWALFLAMIVGMQDEPLTDLQRLAMGNWASVKTVIWFLPAMFSVSMVYGLLLKLPTKYSLIISGLLVLLSPLLISKLQPYHGLTPFGLDVAVLMAPLALLVIALSKRFYSQLTDNQRFAILGFFVTLWIVCIIYLPYVKVNGFSKQLDMAQLNLPHLAIVGSLCLTFMLGVSVLRKKTFLVGLGQATMPIFALHMTVLVLINPARPVFTHYPDLSYWAIAIATTLICYFIALLIKKLDPRFSYLGLA